MAGAIFSRIKTWISTEDVTAADLNAEFDNILNNLLPAQLDDYSVNTAQMQLTVDPGEVGTESAATTLAGEIERFRFALNEIKGTTQWYESPATSIADLDNAVGTGVNPNRLISGKTLAGSEQALFLKADGSATTATLEATATDFLYAVNGTIYTISADVDITGLSVAPAANNTALVDDPSAADGNETKYLGQFGGEYRAFKINDGSNDEYFTARIKDAATLVECRRGYFFDSTRTHVPAIAFTNNDTITLINTAWLFAKTDLTLAVTYNEPIFSVSTPVGPAIGDYWFDFANNIWKRYNGTSWDDALATLIGLALIDDTNCVASRSFDFFDSYDDLNTVDVIWESNTQVRSKDFGAVVSVKGTQFRFEYDDIVWDISADLESGESETSSTYYYLYVTETGDTKMSTKAPLELFGIRRGLYHQEQTWRCVGKCYNDGSSNLSPLKLVSTGNTKAQSLFSNNDDNIGTTYLRFGDDLQEGELELTGTQTVSRYLYAELFDHLGTNVGEGDAADTFHLPDMDGQFIRTTDNGAGVDADAAGRTAMNTNGNTGDAVGSVQDDSVFAAHNHKWYEYNGTGSGVHGQTYNSGGTAIDITPVLAFSSNQVQAQQTSSTVALDDSWTNTQAAVPDVHPTNAYLNIFMKVSR